MAGDVVPAANRSSASSLPSLTEDIILNQPGKSVGDYSLNRKKYVLTTNVLATSVISYKMEGTRVIKKLKGEESKDL